MRLDVRKIFVSTGFSFLEAMVWGKHQSLTNSVDQNTMMSTAETMFFK